MVRGRYGGLDVDTHQRTFCRDKPLHINCMGHIAGTVCKLERAKRIEAYKSQKAQRAPGNYFVAGKFARAVRTMRHCKLGSFVARIQTSR